MFRDILNYNQSREIGESYTDSYQKVTCEVLE